MDMGGGGSRNVGKRRKGGLQGCGQTREEEGRRKVGKQGGGDEEQVCRQRFACLQARAWGKAGEDLGSCLLACRGWGQGAGM